MLRDVEGKELPLRQAAVLQRIAVIFRLGKISLVELALVSDDEAAGLQRDDIGLERGRVHRDQHVRSEEHTSELQSLMRISYAVFCLKKKNKIYTNMTNDVHKCS